MRDSFLVRLFHPRRLSSFAWRFTTDGTSALDSKLITALREFMAREQPLFCSWGNYDRSQFQLDAGLHRITLPFGPDHLNIKQAFSDALGTRKRFGMAGALRRLGLALDGTHHRGIDDARNIARILLYAIGATPLPADPH